MKLKKFWDLLIEFKTLLMLMIGVPNYERYVEIQKIKGEKPLSYRAFIQNRIKSRYDGSNSSCC